MRSRGRALVQHDRCVYKGRTQTHAEGRLCEDAGRRLPSAFASVLGATPEGPPPGDGPRWDPRPASCISALTGVAVGRLCRDLSAPPCREVTARTFFRTVPASGKHRQTV